MIVTFLIAAIFSHGPGESRQTVTVGGRERSFVLYQPVMAGDGVAPGVNDGVAPGVNGGQPLVIALHGRLGTGAGMEKLTHLERVAAREKFLLIYPDGVRKSWNDGRATPAEKEGVDDVAFIRELMDSAVRHCGVDPKRIYVTGISNGGFMTMRVATELSDRVAAAAVVAATMDEGTAHAADVAVMVEEYARGAGGAKGAGGAGGTEVVDYVIRNGGHTWPGGWQYLPVFMVGKTTRNLDASEVIWAFFKRHSRY